MCVGDGVITRMVNQSLEMDALRRKIQQSFCLELDLDTAEIEDEYERQFVVECVGDIFKVLRASRPATCSDDIESFVFSTSSIYRPVALKMQMTKGYTHDVLTVSGDGYVLTVPSSGSKDSMRRFVADAVERVCVLEIAKIERSAKEVLEKENSFLGMARFIKKMSKQASSSQKAVADGLFVLGDLSRARNLYRSCREGDLLVQIEEMCLYCTLLLGETLDLAWITSPRLANTDAHIRVLYFLIEYYRLSQDTVPGHVLRSYLHITNERYVVYRSLFTVELVRLVRSKRRLFCLAMVEAIECFNARQMAMRSVECQSLLSESLDIGQCSVARLGLSAEPDGKALFANERVIRYIKKIAPDES